MTELTFGSDAPHRDPDDWTRIVETLEGGSLQVAIAALLGDGLQAHLTLEDVWQETLCMAWRDRGQHEWESMPKYRAWLFAIARNRVRDAAGWIHAAKRGGSTKPVPFSVLAEGTEASVGGLLPPRSTTPSRVAERNERVEAMLAALHALPTKLREPVRLRLFEHHKIREVAERLGIPVPTAKRRLYRGAELFRRELERRGGGETRFRSRTS